MDSNYISFAICLIQIFSIDLSHSPFLYVLNYVALLKHIFNLTLHYYYSPSASFSVHRFRSKQTLF